MSTDEHYTPLIPTLHEGYDVIEHRNSHRSYRNGTSAHNHRKGLNHFTYQVIRRLGGLPLPHFPTPPSHSKYTPHVGAKQLAKLS